MADPSITDQIACLSCWSGSVEIQPLMGGMTNRNYLVAAHNAERFVVRVGHDLPEHGVLRFNELAAARAAFAAGVSPEVVFAGQGMLVSRYIAGRTLAPADVQDEQQLLRIAALLRRCHQEVPRHFRGPALIFWVFQVIRNYLGLLQEPHNNPLGWNLTRLGLIAEGLERSVGAVTIVFGHNDLLAANLIDDGTRLWLIDWDYAGFNSPLFDLANLASNNALTPELESVLLESYFGTPLTPICRRGFAAMKCASLLREALWGAVSLQRSSIAFDYTSYAQDYLARLDALLPQLAHQLSD